MKRLRLHELRELRALSQAELAERAGIAKATVNRLEKPGHPPSAASNGP
jgi:transcriptional regulator with XRE-family HTH domain